MPTELIIIFIISIAIVWIANPHKDAIEHMKKHYHPNDPITWWDE